MERQHHPPALELRDRHELRATLRQLRGTARHEYLQLHDHRGRDADPGWPARPDDFAEPPAPAMLDRGVRLRLLHTYRCLDHAGEAEYLDRARARGADVRLTTSAPLQLAVVDEQAVLMPHDPPRPGGLLIRDPTVVTAIRATWSSLWAQSRPATAGAAASAGAAQAPPELQPVLDALLSGLTDAAAARKLNMAPRTYSRRVTQLLDELGATTRAQAGAEACRRGWAGSPGRAGQLTS